MFTPIDYSVLVVYFIIITFLGLWFGRKEKTTDDFFLGGRTIPWLAVCLSVLATEASAVTYIGAPAESFQSNCLYFQLAIGSFFGRLFIAFIFLPHFYQQKVTSIYEYLEHVFGISTRLTAVIFFFITRLLASGVRLYVAALALHVITQLPLVMTIVLVAGIALIYTYFGGIKAVIWTDVFQIVLFYGGAICALVCIINKIPGGIQQVYTISEHYDKLSFFNFKWNIYDGYTFIGGIIGGFFLTVAALGTDQDLTQRMLTCKNARAGKKALIGTGILTFPIVLLFLFIGVCIFVFHKTNPSFMIPSNPNHIFPFIIVHILPQGISGLLLAGIFSAAMSSLDSALNSLSTSAVVDIYRSHIKKNESEAHYIFIARLFVVFFTIILIGIAYLCRNLGTILVMAFKITSYTYGGLLGIFLLGILTKRGRGCGNIIAMTSSIVFVYCITSLFTIGFTWYVVMGALWTCGIGALFRKQEQ
ncbi:sodium:solute symporter [Chlamydiota bacterium]